METYKSVRQIRRIGNLHGTEAIAIVTFRGLVVVCFGFKYSL